MDHRIEVILGEFEHLDQDQRTIMKDALYQWATNRTSGTAIQNKHHPDHHPIKSNLKLRYGLTSEQGEEVYANFKAHIESAGFEFNTGYLEAAKGIEEYFAQDPALRDAVLGRLKTAPQDVQYIAWLFSKHCDYFGLMCGTENTENFAALLGAAFNIPITNSLQQVPEPLIKLGFQNEICWTSAGGIYHRDLTSPEYLKPLVADIDRHISLPDLPDFRKYVDAIFERKRINSLTVLEELTKGSKSTRCEGMSTALDVVAEIVPQPYLIGKWQSVLAINPRIHTDMKSYFFDGHVLNIVTLLRCWCILVL